MKKTAENRYPHSATLFRFCKEALEIRYEGNVKVIDQDVGAILGYDPADCSHWKKGKKNIRALATLRSIADHLNIDERLLIDIAAGKVGLEEAVFEYRGYGSFALTGRHLENLKKEFFKNPTRWQGETGVTPFEELFDVDRAAVVAAADAVVAKGNFTEAPLYLPEVFALFPKVRLVQVDAQEAPVLVEAAGGAASDADAPMTTIKWRGPEMRPYVRFLVAKELFKHLCRTHEAGGGKFASAPAEVQDIQANVFAGALLVPGALLRREVEAIDSSIDLVAQLAETFWTSKAMMNQRLRDYLEHLT
jgi:hypothetical protein